MATRKPRKQPSSDVRLSSLLDLEAAMGGRLENDLLPPRADDRITGELGQRFVSHLTSLLDQERYVPSAADVVYVPKPGFTSRPAAALTLIDRIVYAAIVEAMSPSLEAYLVPADIAMWPRATPTAPRWQEFERAALQGGYEYIVRADIASFYDSVDHSALEADLVYATGQQRLAAALTEFLSAVMRAPRGLPQGLIASDALATVFLRPVDAALTREGFSYVRHGDDVRIAARTISNARGAVLRFEQELRARGLMVNSAKCTIVTRATYESGLGRVSKAIEAAEAALRETREARLRADPEALGKAMEKAELDSQVAWDLWYHQRISVEEVIGKLSEVIQPKEVEVAEHMFAEALSDFDSDRSSMPKEQLARQLKRALVRMAAGHSRLAIDRAASVVARFPEQTEVVCRYLEALRRVAPLEVAKQIANVLTSDVYTTPWQKAWLLRVLGPVLDHAGDELRATLVELAETDADQWLVRVEAMKALAQAGALEQRVAVRAWKTVPPAHRSDVLAAICLASRGEEWAKRFISVSQRDPVDRVVVAHTLADGGERAWAKASPTQAALAADDNPAAEAIPNSTSKL